MEEEGRRMMSHDFIMDAASGMLSAEIIIGLYSP